MGGSPASSVCRHETLIHTNRNHVGKMDSRHGIHIYAQKPCWENRHQEWDTHVCTETVSGKWTSGMEYTCTHRNRFGKLDVRRRTHLLPWHGCQRRRRAPADCGSLPPARGVCSTCLRFPGGQLGSHTAPPQSGQPESP